MKLTELLCRLEPDFDSNINMLACVWKGPGYHTRIPNGTRAHQTRESMDYALALLMTQEPDKIACATEVIKTVLSLQCRDPYRPEYGIWPWLYEEPLEKMSPPDWNWADFIGVRLGHVLVEYSHLIPADLKNEIAEAIGHAAWSIFRRNIQPNYTNIAIMGIVVTAIAGEALNEPRLLEYARSRMRTFLEHTIDAGGLNEYNSPCYTPVALKEAERIIQLVQDKFIVENAEKLRCFIWKALADHFHPATGQLAGPFSRTYSDRLNPQTYKLLTGDDTGLGDEVSRAQLSSISLKSLPCPAELCSRFHQLPEPELERCDRFNKYSPDSMSIRGITWMNQNCCLGSVNRGSFWTQRRSVIGYWTSGSSEPAVIKARFIHDGQDFASAGVFNAQSGNRVLSGVRILTDRGDFHPSLDRPADHVFNASNLAFRYELLDDKASVRELKGDKFELSAGDFKAVIHTIPGWFGGETVEWRCGSSDGVAWVDAVCYCGPEREFVFDREFTAELGAAMELLPVDRTPDSNPAIIGLDEDTVRLEWNDLTLSYSYHAGNGDE